MDDKLNEFFNIYKEYLVNDKIIIVRDVYNFSILQTGKINRFQIFLEENKQYFTSKKYVYIKCLYLYFKKEYNEIFEYMDTLIDEPNYLYLIGFYYQHIKQNYDLMKKYYMMSIKLNHYKSMSYLALYYKNIETNYDLMKKYYMMAIELNYSLAMYNLASYYEHIEKNYDLMKKYYIMAIELNYEDSINNLKLYCKTIENNESNYYKYVYYPRILILILCNRKLQNKSLLPEELLNQIIFKDYILDSK